MKKQTETDRHGERRRKVAWQLTVIGANIRKIRKEKGLSQEQLADRSCLEWRSVQRFEKGKNNILTTTMLRLLATLGCRFEDVTAGAADGDWEKREKEAGKTRSKKREVR